MNDIFLSSGSCDSFKDGVLITTLPYPLDMPESMGINLCDLSFGGVVNIPGGLDFTVGGKDYVTDPLQTADIDELLEHLVKRTPDYSFSRRKQDGAFVAKFPRDGVVTLSEVLQKITGWGQKIRNGDVLESGWDLFYAVPYLTVELDAVDKTPYGVDVVKGLRMVPMEYKNDGDNYRFEFTHPHFVPLKRGEIKTLKLYLSSRFGVVDFLHSGSLYAHLQVSPITKQLLI
jgi:hypothetical protein